MNTLYIRDKRIASSGRRVDFTGRRFFLAAVRDMINSSKKKNDQTKSFIDVSVNCRIATVRCLFFCNDAVSICGSVAGKLTLNQSQCHI